MCLYAHIFILCLLLQTPVLCAALVRLQRHFRHFSLFVIAMAADPVVVGIGVVFGGVFHFDPSAPSASLLAFAPNFPPAPPPAANIGPQALCVHSGFPCYRALRPS